MFWNVSNACNFGADPNYFELASGVVVYINPLTPAMAMALPAASGQALRSHDKAAWDQGEYFGKALLEYIGIGLP